VAGLTGYFFDTSVLLAGIVELSSGAAPQQRIMAAVSEGHFERPMTAWHCCLEFFSVATRLPGEFRVTPDVAARLVEEELLGRFRVHGLPSNRRLAFVRQAVLDGISGGRIYDAHIAEIARGAGADVVVTDNRRHFIPLLRHGVKVLVSTEVVEELGL
jgi:predicted nucleic acid-binding protein